jgi:hypothetical protein
MGWPLRSVTANSRWITVPGASRSMMYRWARGSLSSSAGTCSNRMPNCPGELAAGAAGAARLVPLPAETMRAVLSAASAMMLRR